MATSYLQPAAPPIRRFALGAQHCPKGENRRKPIARLRAVAEETRAATKGAL